MSKQNREINFTFFQKEVNSSTEGVEKMIDKAVEKVVDIIDNELCDKIVENIVDIID